MEQTKTTFSGSEQREEFEEYRALSPLALLSLLFGIGSVLALVHPATWVVPAAAVALGVFALRSIRKNDNVQGAVPAWAGIVLGLFFVSWAGATFYFERWVVYQEAKAISMRWLELVVRGEDEIAHQAMLHPASRQSAGFSVDDYYRMDEKVAEDKEKVFTTYPTSDILGVGADARIEHVRNVLQGIQITGTDAQLIRQIYRVTPPDKPPVEVMLSITREYRDDLQRATWIVADCIPPE